MSNEDTLKNIIIAVIAIIAGFIGLTTDQQAALVPVVLTIIGAIIACLNSLQVEKTVAAFTSGSAESKTPSVIAKLPAASWKMSDEARHNLVMDASPANKALILAQVEAAEATFKTHYRVNFNGGFFIIDYGLILSAVGDPHNDNGDFGGDIPDTFYVHPRTGNAYITKEMAISIDGAPDAPIRKYRLVGSAIIDVTGLP